MHLTYPNSDEHKATASTANAGEAGAPGKELELALAEAVLSALRAASRQPYIVGDVTERPGCPH